MSRLQYSIESWVGDTRVVVSGELSELRLIISQAQELDAARIAATPVVRNSGQLVQFTAADVVAQAASTEVSGPVKAVTLNQARLDSAPDSEGVVYPSVDDVATAVKEFVGRVGSTKGVPKSAELLQSFGAAKVKDVQPDQRAAFIAKVKEATV